MCIICDGATREEAFESLHNKIQRFGWAIQYVEGSPGNLPWGYTIGLIDTFDHPELVVVGLDAPDTFLLLRSLVDNLGHCQQFTGQSLAMLPDRSVVRFVAVHPGQFNAGVLAAWNAYYEALGRDDLEQRALQVLPCGVRDAMHTRPVPRLDRATTMLADRPNRAQRRAQSRRRPRGR